MPTPLLRLRLARFERVPPLPVLLLVGLLALLACTSNKDAAVPSGASCPEGASLTYEGFVAPFMTKYCNDCHGSNVLGADRQGAPSGHNFDSLEGILAEATHIDEQAAFGPDSSNDAMPPSGDKPSRAEREQLGEWIACQVAAGHVGEHEHADDDHHEDSDGSAGHEHEAGVEHSHDEDAAASSP